MHSVIQPAISTVIVISLLIGVLIATIGLRPVQFRFSQSDTQELKGVAILMILFAHIGNFLTHSPHFLWPLSLLAGVGVDLFLFVSGYGLCKSQMVNKLSLKHWYKKRLFNLFIPLWLVLTLFALMDVLILDKHYSVSYLVHAYLGIFPTANLWSDINSVLWYFTLILFYYLLFPIAYIRKHVWLTAIILFFASLLFLMYEPFTGPHVKHLYKLHLVAFPLGVLIAALFSDSSHRSKFKKFNLTGKKLKNMPASFIVALISLALVFAIGYFAYHSGVGKGVFREELICIITMLLIVVLFVVKQVKFKFLLLMGIYSYELYLLHWPLLARYDFLYNSVPGWIATLLWLCILLSAGWILKKLTFYISNSWK
ncbi:MAG TPA: acyltransferase [Candidatus Saccharimonadales bacterium]|nr:acyltransferase [Candidatus Saccharimonadales bacterium]